ncbi:MAG: hypothetical protein AMJ46_06855 [Latescibacteria bacterium DG_63]|nr:MAG: hypothetical protein AMJ46_06855 [Latescibacteria bacterium DG_63]
MNAQEIRTLAEDVMQIRESGVERNAYVFRGMLYGTAEETMTRLKGALEPFSMVPLLSQEDGGVVLRIGFLKIHKKTSRSSIHLLLFALTVVSTLYAGAAWATGNPLVSPVHLVKGVPFSLSILLILGSHELGHFITSRRSEMDASLPYFIPFPFVLGTLGAVIRQRSPMPDRNTLLRVGVAGPLVGLAFALPITVIGLRLSEAVPLSQVQGASGYRFGESLLFGLLMRFLMPVTSDSAILLHPVAIAGWAGILVTGMNLLPAGQLDGGHVGYAILGRLHKWVARGLLVALIGLGLWWQGWWVWAVLLFLFGVQHPPPLDDITPLGRTERVLGWLCLALFVLTFTPIPLAFELQLSV